jgi:imidazolonepropionase-like amidohydrolase
VDGVGEAAAGTVRIKQPADNAPTLDRQQNAGCLEVKIYSSVSPALVPEIAREAHKRGLRVTGHVPFGMDAQQALDAGYDAINHITYLILDDITPEERRKLSREARMRRLADFDLKSPRMEKLYRTLKTKGAYLDDTVALYELLFHGEADNEKNEPGIAKLPREVRAMIGSADPKTAAASSAGFEKYIELLGELHKRGIPVVAGTDIAVPGHSLHRELELYVRAGFTPMEAIQAATSIPAKLMHMENELGTIAPGKRADLAIVDGDPTRDIKDIRKVVTVIARGKAYDAAALWKIAGFTP